MQPCMLCGKPVTMPQSSHTKCPRFVDIHVYQNGCPTYQIFQIDINELKTLLDQS